MRKSLVVSGLVVGSLRKFYVLCTVVKTTPRVAVDKIGDLALSFTCFVLYLYTCIGLTFGSVVGRFLHTIHKTYNYVQLFNISNSRGLVYET